MFSRAYCTNLTFFELGFIFIMKFPTPFPLNGAKRRE